MFIPMVFPMSVMDSTSWEYCCKTTYSQFISSTKNVFHSLNRPHRVLCPGKEFTVITKFFFKKFKKN